MGLAHRVRGRLVTRPVITALLATRVCIGIEYEDIDSEVLRDALRAMA